MLAGCGEDAADDERLTKEEYLAEAREIVEDAQPASQLFTELVVGAPPTQELCARTAEEFHEELERIVGEIEDLRPPAEIALLHEEFVAAAQESVQSVGRTSDAVEREDVRCGMDINGRIYGLPSTRRAESVLDELDERGYVILGD